MAMATSRTSAVRLTKLTTPPRLAPPHLALLHLAPPILPPLPPLPLIMVERDEVAKTRRKAASTLLDS